MDKSQEYVFRLFDFNVYNEKRETDSSSGSDNSGVKTREDDQVFQIQMFGVNEQGDTCCIFANDFLPFFYVKVDDCFNVQTKTEFLKQIVDKIGKFYEKSIVSCKLLRRKKLYGFDGGKEHNFICFQFSNMQVYHKVKNLYYDANHTLIKTGYKFKNKHPTFLYEANIPPLLRFFHIRDISPSGWISVPKNKTVRLGDKKTTCTVEFSTHYKNVVPLNDKETRVPFKICSFDIEASSSHGDFPVPVKTYKKLANNIMEYFEKFVPNETTPTQCQKVLRSILKTAFQLEQNETSLYIDTVFPKDPLPTLEELSPWIEQWMAMNLKGGGEGGEEEEKEESIKEMERIETLFEKMNSAEDDDNEYGGDFHSHPNHNHNHNKTVIDWLLDKHVSRDMKINHVNLSLNRVFPKLEGDKVTFIGSTFMRYGEEEPYFHHCIALNTCNPVAHATLESYSSERDVLLAWQKLIQRENPDIVIGYNIFGFDYQFLFQRAEEMGCAREFLKLSRNNEEICWNYDKERGRHVIEESSIQIASGQHDLKFIKMNGRLQIDLYNFFRREENLTSYKLDFVAGHFIGDSVKQWNPANQKTEIVSNNLKGLQVGSFIHLEEIGHSVDYYDGGAKFLVRSLDAATSSFVIDGMVNPDKSKKVRWCLAKDDVSPKDIFQMTNGTDADRAVIAKYCIQDCNLVHCLLNKVDILTGFIEMAKICSVPMNFLVMRGQGIKLTSYIAKKCREKGVLMPVIEKGSSDEGYEGAIVLDPKCDLYLDNPVACVDYASLYPSSMISENLSHDSKVWTQEFDLDGTLIKETGEKDAHGDFIYDHLPGYEYVNVTYDTYKYVRKSPKAAAEKVISGRKICRFAQFPEGKAIMPSILEELLQARKATRKLIPQQTDEFMKNVLDKRQLGYKVTANSLYGQCGAKTSTFYEKDIAACTTATGRLLLTYAKKIIETCYGDSVCDITVTNLERVRTKAEYIYGDTDSVFFTFNLETLDGTPIRGKEALEITIELAQEAGHLASSFLKPPHDLEYEKTFMPFCLLSKKRYVGMLYETDPTKGKRKEMGIVLKRRDNAPIVKDIYGGIIDILMKEQNIHKAMEFLKSCLRNIVNEAYPVEKLIITKSLRSNYKNPQSIAHKVLADRITARDPGNKPGSGDRIPFVYIHNENKKALQGERIETPAFVAEHHLKIDYSFYITNQIMKPVQQVFALVIEKIWENQKKMQKLNKFRKEMEGLKKNTAPEKWDDKYEQVRNKEVKELLFDEFLRDTNNAKTGNQSVTKFFGAKK